MSSFDDSTSIQDVGRSHLHDDGGFHESSEQAIEALLWMKSI
jgi:hypothetical protein